MPALVICPYDPCDHMHVEMLLLHLQLFFPFDTSLNRYQMEIAVVPLTIGSRPAHAVQVA